MSAILVGSFVFICIFIVAAYISTDQATRDVTDINTKIEYIK